jgi:glucokinase
MLGHRATWEEAVSDRGVARIHAALVSLDTGTAPQEPSDLDALVVSEAAASGDPLAEQALAIYYRALGRFVQLLALSEQPCAGVFVGGTVTLRNLEFVRRGDLVREFLDNRFVGHALAEVPLHVVEGDVNLAGAVRIAAQAARARPPKAQFRSFGD